MMLFLKNIKDNLAAFRQEESIRSANRIYFGIVVFEFLMILLFLRRLPPQLPFFYSLPWGNEQLTSPVLLLVLPVGCLLSGIINFSLAAFSFVREPLAAKILAWINVLVSFLAALTLIRIIFLVI